MARFGRKATTGGDTAMRAWFRAVKGMKAGEVLKREGKDDWTPKVRGVACSGADWIYNRIDELVATFRMGMAGVAQATPEDTTAVFSETGAAIQFACAVYGDASKVSSAAYELSIIAEVCGSADAAKPVSAVKRTFTIA